MRINITIDSETVHLPDRLARTKKVSRSAILREGVRALAENQRREVEEAEVRERRRNAIGGIRRIAPKPGDAPAEKTVRECRHRWTR